MTRDPSLVAFFAAALPRGGAERALLSIAEGFGGRGYRVHLVLATTAGALLDDVPPTVEVIQLGRRRSVSSVFSLARYLRRERPGAVIAALTHANLVAIAARGLARSPTTVVVSEHTNLSRASAASSDRRERVMPALVRIAYPRAGSVVAVSQGVALDLMTVAPRLRPTVIPNPLRANLTERALEPAGHDWMDHATVPVILAVGRLVDVKAFDVLIRAFALVHREVNCRLVVLGEGESRPKLESVIDELGLRDCIALPGWVDNPYPWIKRARVVALSSRREGLPTVLLEALALGKVIVATDCASGPREILNGGRYGRLVRVDDVPGLADALTLALADDATYDPQDACREYTMDTVLDAYIRAARVDAARPR